MLKNNNVKDLMLDFKIPEVLKDDIVYCQYSLRYFIKIHQLWANKIFTEVTEVLPAREILKKIEEEMREIGVEQNFLTKILRNLLTGHCDMLRGRNIMDINMELINGYVARALSMHYENYFATIKATNVKSRLEPAYLAEKFGPAFMDNTQDEFQLQSYQSSKPIEQSAMSAPYELQPQHKQSSLPQQSLLKPKEERIVAKITKDTEPPKNEPNFLMKRMHFRMMKKQRESPVPIKPIISPAVVHKLIKPIVIHPKQGIREVVAINNSRLNLLQALNKAKSQKLTPKNANDQIADNSESDKKSRADSVSPDEKPKSVDKVRSSKSKSNSPSPSPSLNDSDEKNSSIVECEPSEEKELGQEGFLKVFGLYTIEYSKYLLTHKISKRRRRLCTTEKSDFHYGLDAYEFYKAQHQTSKRGVNKKSILYSPPQTRNVKKRKSDDDPSVLIKKARTMVVNQMEDVQEHPCIICSRKGNTNNLSACVYCYNFYHLSCHKSTNDTMRERENICPICYRKKQLEDKTSTHYKHEVQKRDRLRRIAELAEIRNKCDDLEKKLNEKNDEKKKLLHDERRTKQKINYLLSIVDKFVEPDNDADMPSPVFEPLDDIPEPTNVETSETENLEKDDKIVDQQMAVDQDDLNEKIDSIVMPLSEEAEGKIEHDVSGKSESDESDKEGKKTEENDESETEEKEEKDIEKNESEGEKLKTASSDED